MLTRYPIVMAVLVLCTALAGWRLLFLARLVGSGQPAPGRTSGWARRLLVEMREVIGQRRLLKWTVPGLAHAFTFWGFLVLVFTGCRGTFLAGRARHRIPAFRFGGGFKGVLLWFSLLLPGQIPPGLHII